jgi:hypothetical protein
LRLAKPEPLFFHFQWLSSQDIRLLETVEFALCLNGLGSWGEGGLKLHVSRPPKQPAIQELYSTFTEVAAELGIPLEIVQRKVNLGNPRVSVCFVQIFWRRYACSFVWWGFWGWNQGCPAGDCAEEINFGSSRVRCVLTFVGITCDGSARVGVLRFASRSPHEHAEEDQPGSLRVRSVPLFGYYVISRWWRYCGPHQRCPAGRPAKEDQLQESFVVSSWLKDETGPHKGKSERSLHVLRSRACILFLLTATILKSLDIEWRILHFQGELVRTHVQGSLEIV